MFHVPAHKQTDPAKLPGQVVHTPTGKSCSILIREADRSFCNFGAANNPFSWVNNSELQGA